MHILNPRNYKFGFLNSNSSWHGKFIFLLLLLFNLGFLSMFFGFVMLNLKVHVQVFRIRTQTYIILIELEQKLDHATSILLESKSKSRKTTLNIGSS